MRENPVLCLIIRFIVVGHTTNVILFLSLCVRAHECLTEKERTKMSTTPFQLACIAEPLELKWGPSHYDKGQKARAIQVHLDYADQKTEIDAIDDSLVKFDDSGRAVLRLKV
jgi:hypothetical protein